MKRSKMKSLVCLRCSFTWKSKLERPKYCPSCKQAKWDTPPRIKKEPIQKVLKKTQDEIFDNIGNDSQTRHEALRGIWLGAGLTVAEFAERIGTTTEKLQPYLDGKQPVTETQLAVVRRIIGNV